MITEIAVPPFAPAMLDSLRAIGYSFEAALADIIDNSIAAEASSVDVQFRTQPVPYVAIIDDGVGMSPAALREAMRHGGIGPNQPRSATDLGRFGLGLKTASLSQCRRLVLATRRDGVLSGAVWDLDRIKETGEWTLGLLGPEELAQVPHIDQLATTDHGTIVLWEQFDRALAGESAEDKALGALVDRGRDHLSLAFHRYLDGDAARLKIAVNNAPVVAIDPFLSAKSQRLPPETLSIQGSTVSFHPFILPHLSKMSRADLELAGGEAGLRRYQGFYVYRNKRLITYGTWFRLLRQEELSKLARVQVDIPNTLDHLWALDVKKSTAYPPEAIRTGLQRVVERIAGTSRQVYTFRGRRTPGVVTPVWERVSARDGFDYLVNRSHPAVELARSASKADSAARTDQLLRTIELALPTDSLYADIASDLRVKTAPEDQEIEELLMGMATSFIDALGSDEAAVDRALGALGRVEPFSDHPAITRKVAERIRSGRG
jgi:hypothetical protein